MAGRPHWLRPPGATSTPPVVVCFDTETRTEPRRGTEVEVLRLWAALTRTRPAGQPGAGVTIETGGSSAAGLADTIEAAAELDLECWCFAHNLGFDLAVTSLPDVLSFRGWKPTFVHIGDESCVFKLARDGHTLVITDSWSWLRCSLQAAAGDVGMRKTRLPGRDATAVEWEKRCRHDVLVLDRLVVGLLDWWDARNLGPFGVTSSSCGWRSLRAHIKEKTVLVGPEPPRTTMERDAILGGRKQVWQAGKQPRGCYDDWDLVAAYPTVVARLELPMMPLRGERWRAQPDPLNPPAGCGTICRVKVTTSTPCAPCQIGQGVWWPVGQFTTTLTSAELPFVCEHADQVQVLAAQWYRLGDGLQRWGRWAVSLLEQDRRDVPPVVRRVAKGWGRSVTGRFALQTSRLISSRPATRPGWGLETGTDAATGQPIEVITWGGVERTFLRDQDGQEVSPAVLAFIEGHVRAALGRLIASRPAGCMVQCNTDGWWERRPARTAGGPPERAFEPFGLARKATVTRLEVLGPNHTLAPGDQRLSGIPAGAQPTGDGGFTWTDWPGLRWQLQVSRPGEYVKPVRTARLDPHYVRGWVLEDGRVVPPATTITAEGTNQLSLWSVTPRPASCGALAAWQVPELALLRDGG